MDWRLALTLALAAFVLWRNLPGALLCLFPRLMRARGEDESWPQVDAALFQQMDEELAPLGFTRLGVHIERAPLRRGVLAYDYVHGGEATWGTAYTDAREVRLVLLTRCERGGFVLTADHPVMSQDREGCLAGGIPGAQPEQLLAAHRRRVERMRQAGRPPLADLSLEARVKAADAWFHGCGAREVRLRNLNGLAMTLLAFALVGALFWGPAL